MKEKNTQAAQEQLIFTLYCACMGLISVFRFVGSVDFSIGYWGFALNNLHQNNLLYQSNFLYCIYLSCFCVMF